MQITARRTTLAALGLLTLVTGQASADLMW
jgi:hypothetical protein